LGLAKVAEIKMKNQAAAKPLNDQGKSWPADKVERRALEKLVPYARNARTHSPAQVDQIAASIREWGAHFCCVQSSRLSRAAFCAKDR